MKISNVTFKTIDFLPSEREKVTRKVKRLVDNGWDLHTGWISDDYLVYGEESTISDEHESIQLDNGGCAINPFDESRILRNCTY